MTRSLGTACAATAIVALAAVVRAQSSGAGAPLPAWLDAEDETATLVLTGFVLMPQGDPAAGAVVVSSASGHALTETDGSFVLQSEVPPEADRVQVTAVGGLGGNLIASASVAFSVAPGGSLRVPMAPLQLGPADSCTPAWLPTFGNAAAASGPIHALAVHDDGTGLALYAGGFFTSIGGVTANHVARWDGSSWSAVGGGMNERVFALAVFDDGGGPELYAAGSFSEAEGRSARHIARWDGSSWSRLRRGTDDRVHALAVYDDGGGPALYVGGAFPTADRQIVNGIAKWSGSAWSPLGGGMDAEVHALAAYDDGTGPALYAGGTFSSADGAPASRIAKWDGAGWSPLGAGTNSAVVALAVFDDGNGPALYAGGDFSTADGAPAAHIAKWDGSVWSALGAGTSHDVTALVAYDDGSGPALAVSGRFGSAGGMPAQHLAKWDGTIWSALYGGTSFEDFRGPASLAVYNGALHGGVQVFRAGGYAAYHVAGFDGTKWTPVGDGIDREVDALLVRQDCGARELFAAGDFTTLDGAPVGRIARWDGESWSSLGSGLNDQVLALAMYDGGAGARLVAGGTFTNAGGVAANRIAAWNGAGWVPLGTGVSGQAFRVNALTVFDDGAGPALFVGGSFSSAGGVQAIDIAKWNGTSWAAVGGGIGTNFHHVRALASYDDGTGPALYVGGQFETAGGVNARNIAKWNGASWAPVGGGITSFFDTGVYALTVHDDGSGPALFAGGDFTLVGGVAVSYVAKWDGTTWSDVGGGTSDIVTALAPHHGGSGPALFAGGRFSSAGGVAANRIAKWNGSAWSPLGSGVNDEVRALAVFDDGKGPALFAGGIFTSALDSGDSFLGRWGGEEVVLDFRMEDDFATALANGQDLSSPPEFGELVSISSSGPNARAASFDSTPGGPNDPSQDRDLLVGCGNVVILQTNDNTTQTVPGYFDRPNDDEDGGTIAFDFAAPVAPKSVVLVDIDAGADERSFVILADYLNRTRTYTVPPSWTGDLLTDGTSGKGTLDLTTLAPQPGHLSTATAIETSGFDPDGVMRLEVRLGSSGAVDDLRWCRPGVPSVLQHAPRAADGAAPSGPLRSR